MPRYLRLAVLTGAIAVAAAIVGSFRSNPIFLPAGQGLRLVWLTTYFFWTQDAVWLLVIIGLLGGLAIMRFRTQVPQVFSALVRHPYGSVSILAALVFACGLVGNELVFQRYDLSRDEVQSDFDATIFRSGMAIAPVKPEWQPFARALQPTFMLAIPNGRGFVSSYLPVNAAFRAAVGVFGDPAWTSPLLAALAVFAAFGVARRLWPDRPDAAVISVLLVATSAQVLVTAMTSYAMTAHLALNLVWLWLFLRNDRLGDGAAIGVGFLACGLHQLIFHPLFAAPFIIASRSVRRVVAFMASYAVICLFWISYPQLAIDWQDLAGVASGSADAGPSRFLAQATALVASFEWAGCGLMLKNLLRFVAWQNPILLPLGFLAYRSVRQRQGVAAQLAAGIALTLIATFVLMPYQGHGWGFRYLHGLIGNTALLAGYGWVWLSTRASREEMNASWRMIAAASAVACLILLPAHAKQAHDFAVPYASASDAIKHAGTDLVIVDEADLLFGRDLVRNDPFLRNRPMVLSLGLLKEADIDYLCSRYSISIFDRTAGHAAGIMPTDRLYKVDDTERRRLRSAMADRSCGREIRVQSQKSSGVPSSSE